MGSKGGPDGVAKIKPKVMGSATFVPKAKRQALAHGKGVDVDVDVDVSTVLAATTRSEWSGLVRGINVPATDDYQRGERIGASGGWQRRSPAATLPWSVLSARTPGTSEGTEMR